MALAGHPWLQGIVSEPARLALLHAGIERRYDSDEVLYLAGSPAQSIQLVLEGRVRLMRGGPAQHSTLGRLAGLLLTRAAKARGSRITLGATHQPAAEEIGTVRELVVRGLRTLRERGAIKALGGGRYEIENIEELQRIARLRD